MRPGRMGMVAAMLAAVVSGPGLGASFDDLVQRTYRPETRPSAIAALESLLVADPRDAAARLPLARALSWSGRLDASLAQYDTLLHAASGPDSLALAAERWRVRLWQGHSSEAERAFEDVLARDRSNVDAMLGLAQARRWSGRPLAALAMASEAARTAPSRADAREEMAWSRADLGLGRAGARAIAGLSPPADLREALRGVIGPVVQVMPLVSHESFGVTRSTVRTVISGEVPGDVRLAAGGGLTQLERAGTMIRYATGAASAALRGPHASLEAEVGGMATTDTLLPDVDLTLGLRASDHLQGSFGARRRPFLETSPLLEVGEGAFFTAGVGGATDLIATSGWTVDEVHGRLQGSATSWSYAYSDARGFRIADGNQGYSVAAGIGLDPVRAFGGGGSPQIMMQWDGYWASDSETRPQYFSPARFDAQGVGISARWPVRPHLTLLGSGGGTFSFEGTSRGWYGGGGIEAESRHLEARLRFEARNDLYFDWTRGWLSISLRP